VATRYRLYEFDYGEGTIKLKNRLCPRCGKVMARHSDRWTCGGCAFTIFERGGAGLEAPPRGHRRGR